MFKNRRTLAKAAIVLVLLAVLFGMLRGSAHQGQHGARADGEIRTVAAMSKAEPAGGPCSVPGIGDIAGLLGFCSLGQSGIIGGINNLCQPGVPQPESATTGINALIRPPASPGRPVATPYNQYGMAGQYWAATDLQCSDMTSLIGNNVAGMLFDFAKALDRVTITVYQSAAGEGILGWLQGVTDRLVSGLGNAIYFPYVAVVVILAAIWLAWQGLIRKRGTRTVEGTIWMVLACAAAIWLIGRPADFTGLGKGVSDGISTTLNAAFAHLPSPGQSSCLPVGRHDPQISRSSFSYTSSRTVVDQNANELWSVLVCKPWLDGEFGTTAFAKNGHGTPVSAFARQLLFAQAIAANEHPTTKLIDAKQASYAGIAQTIKTNDPSVYPLFQGKEWTTRLEIAFAALLAALVAGVLVLLISVTLILLKLGFLLLLIVGPFFLLIGTHPGFGRVVAVRWFEMLVGVLLKQAAVALALSVLLYCYALIMGTADAVLPWALKILMITLVTVAVFIYRKPFQHLFTAVGYGALGATERAEASLDRAAATARANTRDAATLGVPGFAAYRAARWARRNPAQAAGLALSAATAASTAGLTARAAAGRDPAVDADQGGELAGVAAGAGTAEGVAAEAAGTAAQGRAVGRARARGGSAGTASASDAPPLRLPPTQGTPASWVSGAAAGSESGAAGARPVPPSWRARESSARRPAQPAPPAAARTGSGGGSTGGGRASGGTASNSRASGARANSGRASGGRASGGRASGGTASGGTAGGGSRPQSPAPKRRSPADRVAPRQPRQDRARGSDRPARSWGWSGPDRDGGGGSGRATSGRRSSGGESSGQGSSGGGSSGRGTSGGASGRGSSGGANSGAGSGPAAPYGLLPKEPDDAPASPFWSRPIRRRK